MTYTNGGATPQEHIVTTDTLEQSAEFEKDRLLRATFNPNDEIIKRGQAAWHRVRGGQCWEDWLLIGTALLIGRAGAMHEAGTNQSNGAKYNAPFSRWLRATKFDVIDKTTRARLFDVMDHRHEIEQWRSTLPISQKLSLNHPTSVLRKWKTSTRIPLAEPPVSPMAKLKAAHVAQIEENHRLKREVELGGGDLWTAQDRPDDIARVMVGKLSPTKAEHVARAMLRRLKERRRTNQEQDAVNAALEDGSAA
jgi:hypothetical protein